VVLLEAPHHLEIDGISAGDPDTELLLSLFRVDEYIYVDLCALEITDHLQ